MNSYYEGAVSHAAAPASRLTDLDRKHIADARALAACAGADRIREHLTGCGLMEPGYEGGIYPFAFGVARSLLGDLAALAERLDGVDA